MSTGDQTAYIRSKIAERGTQKAASFMRDGFDNWAESSAPAREGGLEKEAAPASGRGRSSISKKYIDDSQMVHGGSMHGGISATDFVKLVPDLFDFYNKVKDWTALVKEDLRSPDVPAKYQVTAKTIADTIESIGLGKPPHAALRDSCMMHMMPRHGGARIGGAGWQEWFDKVGKQLKAAYTWFLANKPAIHYLLKMKSINPPGYDYAAQLEKAMTSVGLGRHGGAYPELSYMKEEAFSGPEKWIYSSSGKTRSLNPLFGGAYNEKVAAQGPSEMEYARQPPSKEKLQKVVDYYNSLSGPAKTKFAQGSKYVLDAAREQGLLGNGRMGGASCTCSTSGRKVGGRVGGMMSADQMAAAAKAAMEQVKAKARSVEGTVSPHVQTMVAKAQALEQKARAKVGGRVGGMSMSNAALAAKLAYKIGGRVGGFNDPWLSASDPESIARMAGRFGGRVGGRVGGAVGGRAPSARGAIVKKVMAEHGLSLPQASKYVKQNGLY